MSKCMVKLKFLWILLFICSMHPVVINAQWSLVNSGLDTTSQVTLDFCAQETNFALVTKFVYPNGIVYKTSNGGSSWQQIYSNNNGFPAIEMFDSVNYWVGTDNGKIFKTVDGGVSWNQQFSNSDECVFINYIKFFSSSTGIFVGDPPTNTTLPMPIYKTTDGGTTWQKKNSSYFLGGVSGDIWRHISFTDEHNGFIFVSGTNLYRIFRTTDGGTTWIEKSPQTSDILLIKFFDVNFGLAFISNGIYYRTTNSGETWQEINGTWSGYPNDVAFEHLNPNRIWFTDYYNLYLSSDSAKTFSSIAITSGSLNGRILKISDSNVGWIASDFGKIYRCANLDQISGTESEVMKIAAFKLEQNYPNPFNPATTIKFTIPNVETMRATSLRVTMKVFDILGNEIATLVNEEKEPGVYHSQFSIVNSPFPSGVYFYQLRADQFVETKKMINAK